LGGPRTDGVGAPIPHSEEISQPRTVIEDGRAIGPMYEDRHAKAELRWFRRSYWPVLRRPRTRGGSRTGIGRISGLKRANSRLPAHSCSLCELNVMQQIKNVASDVFVLDAWARGQDLSVHGWVYSIVFPRADRSIAVEFPGYPVVRLRPIVLRRGVVGPCGTPSTCFPCKPFCKQSFPCAEMEGNPPRESRQSSDAST
jgi:hypothetical protein